MIFDFCIIGGGIAGLTIANELVRNSVSVVVIDEDEIGKGAGYYAAGMLAPLIESKIEEVNIVNYGLEALKYYPDYISNLESETNFDVGFKKEGTLLLALNEDDRNILKHRYYEYESLGLDINWLTGSECRELEPNLSAQINTGIFSKSDIQLNNRIFIKALFQNCKNKKVSFHEKVINGELVIVNNTVKEFKFDNILINAKNFIVTCGAKSNKYASQCGIKNLVRPVKGQVIRLDQKKLELINYIIRT
ncbi:MAG: FAD-dependent oxidoreductase, partial [Candidatus Kapaibacterium sp.]